MWPCGHDRIRPESNCARDRTYSWVLTNVVGIGCAVQSVCPACRMLTTHILLGSNPCAQPMLFVFAAHRHASKPIRTTVARSSGKMPKAQSSPPPLPIWQNAVSDGNVFHRATAFVMADTRQTDVRTLSLVSLLAPHRSA